MIRKIISKITGEKHGQLTGNISLPQRTWGFYHEGINIPLLHKGYQPEINKWVLSDFLLERVIPVVGIHPYPIDELMLMSSSLILSRAKLVIEWGTNIGKSARIFHETKQAFDLDCVIHSVDLPPDVDHVEHPGQRRGELVREISSVRLHEGDGLIVAKKLVTDIGDDEGVLFFLDGDHSYETVQKELKSVFSMCPRASVLLHDTFYQEEASGYNIGPFKATNEYLDSMSETHFVFRTNLGLPGMTLLLKK
ncbi:MAG: CmcI family methyltransferase [Verrucomicrobiota bacterium]|nr:CmcI family methyltransferase [Verrucomicrobiota bacterium]